MLLAIDHYIHKSERKQVQAQKPGKGTTVGLRASMHSVQQAQHYVKIERCLG